MHAGSSEREVLAIADACLPSFKAVAFCAFEDHGEMLRGEGGDHPEEVWSAFPCTDQDGNEVRLHLSAVCVLVGTMLTLHACVRVEWTSSRTMKFSQVAEPS
jgi:hypothetical protein